MRIPSSSVRSKMMASLGKLIGVCLCLIAASPLTGHATERIALVIGNQDYGAQNSLRNPVRDAEAVSNTLLDLGFDVITATDRTHSQMLEAIREFRDKSADAELSLFFFAGHAIQYGGRDYLLPTVTRLRGRADIEISTIPLDLIMRQMSSASAIRLMLIDACRNNPFQRDADRIAVGDESLLGSTRGIGQIPAEDKGAMVGFSAEPGSRAFDGKGDHSPFTQALLRHLPSPGVEINETMRRIRFEVFETTNHQQQPTVRSSLMDRVVLADPERTYISLPSDGLFPGRSAGHPSLAPASGVAYMQAREVGAGERLANPVRSGRKQP